MTKWICLILMFVATYGEGYYQVRNCPALNDSPHHKKESNVFHLRGVSSNLTAAVPDYLWTWSRGNQPDGKYEIPYKFHEDVSFEIKEAIYFGMVIIERGTNIIFVKQRELDIDYIYFKYQQNGTVCNSSVGNQRDEQIIQLASWCIQPHALIHELLHAVGMHHEHQRTDRSVSAGTWEELAVAPDPTLKTLTQYDPFSIMHYVLPYNASLRAEDNWTKDDTFIARATRAFPSICDYNGVNQKYKGHVKSPPCTNVRVQPPWLEPTDEGKRKWKKYYPGEDKKGHDMAWACNYLSGKLLGGVPMMHHSRQERTLCQFQANSMYPSFWWIPYAEEVTYPAPGLNYSEFKTFPLKVKPNWMTHDICDCLGPPPFTNDLNDHSMYQTCLECIHFVDTTRDVLKCIARQSGEGEDYTIMLSYLEESYNKTQYYLINPNSSQFMG